MLIGLVGKSCSGKNYVARIMEDLGWQVWDLDAISHDVLDQKVEDLVRIFGSSAVKDGGNGKTVADRRAIGSIVFSNPQKLRQLEDLLYPSLLEMIQDHDRSNLDGVLVINGALLHRAGLDKACKAAIYVDASYETRLSRALKRDGIGAEDFKRRENSQSDVDFRDVTYACRLFIINNNNDIFKKNAHSASEFRTQVMDICSRISLNNEETV